MKTNLKPTSPNRNTVLAIDPSTRNLGLAVFVDRDLVYYAVKTIRPRRPRSALLQTVSDIINQMISEFSPGILAVEKIVLKQKSEALLSVVTDDIRTLATSAGLRVEESAVADIRKRICQSKNATKLETRNQLCARFPELLQYAGGRSKARARHYDHLFDAVALGLACAQQNNLSESTLGSDQPLLF
jgi:Holliday junction resolvasome RuvABC endonuclease subunit